MSQSKDARIRELEARVAELEGLLLEALGKIARLEKTSRTSSKPPSSDLTKPPSPGNGTGSSKREKRKPGGQKGHARNQRPPFTDDQVDQRFDYDFAPGDEPGDAWQRLDDFYIHQQVELRDNPFIITEHRFARYRHKLTGRIINAPPPPPESGLIGLGLFGPRLRALTATLKGELHASFRGMARLYQDAFGLPVSTGYLAKVVAQSSDALSSPYERLCSALPNETVLHLDETGHPDRGERHWLWAAIAPAIAPGSAPGSAPGIAPRKAFSVFKIDKSRGSQVIERLLGPAYKGVIASDFFSAYRKFVKDHQAATPAYCWAHLIREVRYLTMLSDKATANWASKLLDAIKRLFKAYHTPGKGRRAQANAKEAVLKRLRRPPKRGEAIKLASRIKQHKDAYFLFLERDDVEPTNNAAERGLRHGVIHRKLTQGTRGNTGQRWLERMLSIRATCQQQGRSFFDYLVQAIEAHTNGQPSPALLA